MKKKAQKTVLNLISQLLKSCEKIDKTYLMIGIQKLKKRKLS